MLHRFLLLTSPNRMFSELLKGLRLRMPVLPSWLLTSLCVRLLSKIMAAGFARSQAELCFCDPAFHQMFSYGVSIDALLNFSSLQIQIF